ELGLPLKLKRMIPCWFRGGQEHAAELGAPCFAFDLDDDFYYGFPMLDGRTVKLAPHRLGSPLEDPLKKEVDEVPAPQLEALRRVIASHLPRVTPQLDRFSSCIYTLTPDENFL